MTSEGSGSSWRYRALMYSCKLSMATSRLSWMYILSSMSERESSQPRGRTLRAIFSSKAKFARWTVVDSSRQGQGKTKRRKRRWGTDVSDSSATSHSRRVPMVLILTIIEYLRGELYDIPWRQNVMPFSRTCFFCKHKNSVYRVEAKKWSGKRRTAGQLLVPIFYYLAESSKGLKGRIGEMEQKRINNHKSNKLRYRSGPGRRGCI